MRYDSAVIPSPQPSPSRNERLAWIVSAVLLAAGVGLLLDLADRPRIFNWDLVAYTGLVHELEVALEGIPPARRAAEVHRRTYEDLEAELPANVYERLTAHPRYRDHRAWEWGRQVTRDPDAFSAALRFYRGRVGFTGLVFLVHRAGVPTVRAVRVACLAGYVAVVVLLWAWIGSRFHTSRRPWQGPLAGLSVAMATGLAAPLADVARLWTPDLAGAFFLLAGLRALLVRTGAVPALVLFLAAVLVRPDHALTLAIVLAAAALTPGLVRRTRRPIVAAAAVGFPLLYLALGAWSGHPGWTALFHFTFVEERVDLSGASVGWADYLGAFADLAARFGHSASLLFFVLGTLLVTFTPRRWDFRGVAENRILLALLLAFGLRFLLFPVLWPRFWIPLDLFVLIVLCGRLSLAVRAPDGADAGSWRSPTPS